MRGRGMKELISAQLSVSGKGVAPRFPENLPSGWRQQLQGEEDKEYFRNLSAFLKNEISSGKIIFPAPSNVLRALQLVDFDAVKVLILGQDPYHGVGQATGLSFAVRDKCLPKPPSLQNIFKEIARDLKVEIGKEKTELTGWANQGVLLLNTVLTVVASQAFSHRNRGWENFSDEVIRKLNERRDPVIFVLWGAAAQKKKLLLTNSWHPILESAHPSPLSAHRGFLGNGHFSKINAQLEKLGKKPIDWLRV